MLSKVNEFWLKCSLGELSLISSCCFTDRNWNLKICFIIIVPPVLFRLKNNKINRLNCFFSSTSWPFEFYVQRAEFWVNFIPFELSLDC